MQSEILKETGLSESFSINSKEKKKKKKKKFLAMLSNF